MAEHTSTSFVEAAPKPKRAQESVGRRLVDLPWWFIGIVVGLLTGLGRMSHSVVIRNVARMYVELIRGIPMLVLIFFIAFVGVPAGLDLLHSLGEWFGSVGVTPLAQVPARP